MKKPFFLTVALLISVGLSAQLTQTYEIDYTDTTTYSITCGSVNPSQWRVSNQSCYLRTAYLGVAVNGNNERFIQYVIRYNRSGNMESTDYMEFQYLKDGNQWVTFATKFGDEGSKVDTISGFLYTGTGQFTRIRVHAVNDAGNEFWAIDDGAIEVSTSQALYPPTCEDDYASTQENVPITIDVLNNDYHPDGVIDSASLFILPFDQPRHGSATPVVLPNTSGWDLYTILYHPDPNFNGLDTFSYGVYDMVGLLGTARVFVTVTPGNGVRVMTRLFLQGPLDAVAGDMNDNLRVSGYIPLQEPYGLELGYTHKYSGGGESVDPAVLAVSGPDAIIDWVLIELRDAASPSYVIATRAALLQSDGDVVDVDGVSPVSFGLLPPGNFYVAVNHRNHLGAMSATPLALVTNPVTTDIDFTNPGTATWGTYAQWNIMGYTCLIAGDANMFGDVIYAGPGNDAFPVFDYIMHDDLNAAGASNFVSTGYDLSDLNMDGYVIYSGPGNDVTKIFSNVAGHPGNTHSLRNYIIVEQLP